jgi:CelD/BcsL family acetyltransferase involved in cellulose biosynthesis
LNCSTMQMKPHYDIAILKDTQAFGALEEEWQDLYCESPLATPFQSWAWLYSWWEAYGEDYELRLITVRDGPVLVGLIPLMLERQWGFRRLLFIGKYDQLDLLARKGWEDKVSETAVLALRQMIGSWHAIDLQILSPTAAAWGIVQRWNGPRIDIPVTPYLFMEVKPSDELLASLTKKQRQNVRRILRRAEKDGVRSKLVGAEEAEQAAHRLLALHRELWRERQIFSRHLCPRWESFIVAAVRRMTDCGLGTISEVRLDQEVLISSFAAFGDEVTYGRLVGVSQEARQRYQWSSLLIWDALSMARCRNSAWLCLADARDPYKQKWAPEAVPYYRVILGRGSVWWRLYLAYLSWRAKGEAYKGEQHLQGDQERRRVAEEMVIKKGLH